MKTYRVILKPKSAISNYPSSDTLFGAIMWGIREIFGEERLKKYIERFSLNDAPFVLSSSFPIIIPMIQNKKIEIFFLPKPTMLPLKYEDIDKICNEKIKRQEKKYLIGAIESYKRFRKAKFVSLSIMKKLLAGFSEYDLFHKYLTEDIILSSIGEKKTIDYGDEIKLFAGLLITQDESGMIEKILTKAREEHKIIIRNTIDRLSASTGGEGQLFYTEEIFVAKPLFSLYFLIHTTELELKNLIPVLRYLEHTGIGRDRTIGRNHYEISEPVKIDFSFDAVGNKFVCLSRYIPKEGEIVFPPQTPFTLLSIHSKVESRREFKGEDIWKKHFFYFAEGSTLEARERKEFYGITPEAKILKNNRIIQNGLCLPVFGRIGS